MPRLIGELLTIWLVNIITHVCITHLSTADSHCSQVPYKVYVLCTALCRIVSIQRQYSCHKLAHCGTLSYTCVRKTSFCLFSVGEWYSFNWVARTKFDSLLKVGWLAELSFRVIFWTVLSWAVSHFCTVMCTLSLNFGLAFVVISFSTIVYRHFVASFWRVLWTFLVIIH